MVKSCRYALLGLLDPHAAECIRILQQDVAAMTGNSTALLFPPHVTILGRFWAEPSRALTAFHQFTALSVCPPIKMMLAGPMFHYPDLAWLDVVMNSVHFHHLVHLHGIATQLVVRVCTRDETPQEFTGDRYHPHVTLGWGCDPDSGSRVSTLVPDILVAATICTLALVEYPNGWPITEAVRIVESTDLGLSAPIDHQQ